MSCRSCCFGRSYIKKSINIKLWKDSKKISFKRGEISKHIKKFFAIGIASERKFKLNTYASLLSMRRAIKNLK